MVDRLVNSEVNARRVANVEQCFGKMGENLKAFGRVLVGEGVLMKMCRKKAKQRQFFLFNDILVYGNIVISKKRYNKQRIIPLENIEIEDLEDDGALRNGWIIKTPAKSFAVYAATGTEKKEWMLHMGRCISDILEKGVRPATTEHAAVWVPDGEAARCMACGHTQFNLVQRRASQKYRGTMQNSTKAIHTETKLELRDMYGQNNVKQYQQVYLHHCRSCGHVVCGPCSTHTFRLDNVDKKPVRVCDECFKQLSSSKSEPTSSSLTTSPLSDSSSESDGEELAKSTRKIDDSSTFYREEVIKF